MKAWMQGLVWLGVAAATVYAALAPETGVMWQSPQTAIGLGMIGAGLCLEARKRQLKAVAVKDEQQTT